jgi:hypothetical protein
MSSTGAKAPALVVHRHRFDHNHFVADPRITGMIHTNKLMAASEARRGVGAPMI